MTVKVPNVILERAGQRAGIVWYAQGKILEFRGKETKRRGGH